MFKSFTIIPCKDIFSHNDDVFLVAGMNVEVVALGTGSKCIGQSKMNKEGKTYSTTHVLP